MQEYLPNFNPQKFIRTHRSYVVNTDHIDTVNKDHLLINGIPIPIGKPYFNELKSRLNLDK